MSKQAKTLNERELRRVLDHITTRKHAARNRAMLLVTYLAGLRVGETAALRYGDVVGPDGAVLPEIQLTPDQTKGGQSRTVFVSQRLRAELAQYIQTLRDPKPQHRLFGTQKRGVAGFTANTLTQHFHHLYRAAGIVDASSHSGRRTFITTLASKGISVRVLQSLAGHRSMATTQCYIDVNDDMKRKAVELV